MDELSWRLLALGTSLGKLCRPKRCPSSPILAFRCHCQRLDADRRRGQPGRHRGWGGAGVSLGVPTTAPPSAQSPFLSFPSSASAVKPPSAQRQKRAAPGWATLIVCHRNVPDARARGGRASGRRGGPGRQAGRQGGAAGGAGDEPGPEGPTRRSTGAVRPSTG